MAEDVKRKISIFINGKEIEDSLAGVGREIGRINRELKKTSDPAERKRLNAELKNTKKRYGEIKQEINETNVSLNEARGHFSNLVSGLVSGDLQLVQSGLQGITKDIKGATKAALSFIATPLGVFLTGLVGIGYVTKLWADYNIQLYKSTKLTKQLTGLTGQTAREVTATVSALADRYDKDFNDVLRASNALAKQMKISHTDALDLITKGFARGADANGDFLDKLKEYPVQFKNAGYSAEEFIDIATQEAKSGIFSDKLLDTLKEADLALKEMNNAQKEALENAFGKSYTDTLAKGIANGTITTKTAIQSIFNEANRLGLNFQQKQQLIADVFKGAGEDAGGFEVILKNLTDAFDSQNKQLDENETASLRLTNAHIEQEKALADLFDASQSGFPAMLTNIQAIGKEIFTNFLRGIQRSTTSLKTLISVAKEDGSKEAIRDVVEDMQRFGSSKEDAIKYKLQMTQKNIERVKKHISEISLFGKMMGNDKTYQAQLSKFIAYKNELLKIANDTSTEFKAAEDSYINPDKPNKKEDRKDLTPEDKRIKASKEKLAKFIEDWENEQYIQKILREEEQLAEDEAREVAAIEMRYLKMAEQAGFDNAFAAGLEDIKNKEIQAIKDKWSEHRINAQEKENERLAKIDKKFKQKLIKAEEDLEAAKRNLLNSGINFLGSIVGRKSAIFKLLFGLEKAVAINDVIVNTSKANAQIASNLAIANAKAIATSPLTGGMPWVGVNSSLAAKEKLTNNLTAGIQIGNILGTAIQGFYEGGNTGNKAIAYDSNGKITGVVHDNEWVMPKIMTQNPKYAANLAFLENERKMLTKGYYNGGSASSTSNSAPADFENETTTAPGPTTDLLLLGILERAINVLEILEAEGVTMKSDLRNYKTIQKGLDDYAKLKSKNIR